MFNMFIVNQMINISNKALPNKVSNKALPNKVSKTLLNKASNNLPVTVITTNEMI